MHGQISSTIPLCKLGSDTLVYNLTTFSELGIFNKWIFFNNLAIMEFITIDFNMLINQDIIPVNCFY